MEIRQARPEEMGQLTHVARTALLMSIENLEGLRPEWTYCAFEDGRMATSYAMWPLTMRFNGEAVPVAGITSVGTLPVYRRRGFLRQVTAAHFKRLHDEGERPIAVLNASMNAIYQRYGYAVVSTRYCYTVEPRYLEFAVTRPMPGRFREVGEDEFGLLVELYREFREERTGYMHRGRPMWDAGVLAHAPPGGLLRSVVYEEVGEPGGYLVYTIEPRPGTPSRSAQRLVIRDLVWLTTTAYHALWQLLARMDLVVEIAWERAPADDPLPHLLLEPRMLRATASDGIMGRIIDVERALPRRRYPEDGLLTFEVTDELCPWNQGGWRVEVAGGRAAVARHAGEPQLVMPVSTLALLVFGQVTATEAARMGRLEAREPGSLPVWDRVLRTTYRPACADYF